MRPIKFRAFLKKKNEILDVDKIDLFWEKVFIREEVYDDIDYIEYLFSDVELMQFTGLYDKNGKEIYEGDILKGNFHTPIQVYFSNGQFKANVIGKDKQGELTWHGDLLGRTEIIGNIHENPELLEQ